METIGRTGIRIILCLAFMLIQAAAGSNPPKEAAKQPDKEAVRTKAWKTLQAKEFTMLIPSAWRSLEGLPTPLYLNGDGIGAPATDAKGNPIQVGISIERYPGQKGTALEGARQNLAAAKRNRRLEPVGEGRVEEIKLSDGTKAAYLTIDFIKDKTRLSRQQKVLCMDKNSTGWVVIGWIVTGKDSTFIQDNPGLTALIRAHICSIVFDPAKINDAPVRSAYKSLGRPATRPATQPARRQVSGTTTRPATAPAQSPDEIKDVAGVLKNPKATMEDFRAKARALVKSRKLLGLTRKDVKDRLGQPHYSDWVTHLSKPRFMGDRWTYSVSAAAEFAGGRQLHTYARLGLFIRKGKVYACILWVRKRNKLIEQYQEAQGPPIKITWN